MLFLPDTNIIIAFTRRGDANVGARFAEHERVIGLSAVVTYELAFGAFSSDRADHHLNTLNDLPFQHLPFDEADARASGQVRASLKRAGTPIGPYDVLIAGQALARDLTVVTNNTREFARVAGLKLVDWTAP